MRRFSLSAIGRLVHPFSIIARASRHSGQAMSSTEAQPQAIERLHVERAHAEVNLIHLPWSDVRRRASFVNTVPDIHPHTGSTN